MIGAGFGGLAAAVRLAARGHRVTLFCADHGLAPRDEVRDGYRVVRRGSRTSVYLRAALRGLRGGFDRPDVVVDVQNGMPFLARRWSRAPVVVLVHHVHREQWGVVFGPLVARVGWAVESRLAPRLHRRLPHVAVSGVTRDELAVALVLQHAVAVDVRADRGVDGGVAAARRRRVVRGIVLGARLAVRARLFCAGHGSTAVVLRVGHLCHGDEAAEQHQAGGCGQHAPLAGRAVRATTVLRPSHGEHLFVPVTLGVASV